MARRKRKVRKVSRKKIGKKKVVRKFRARRRRLGLHRSVFKLGHRRGRMPLGKAVQQKREPAVLAKEEIKEVLPTRSPALKKQILLCPGPVNLSTHVRAALAGPDICHREREFLELLQTIRVKLVHALDLGSRYTPVLINGSGTAAVESAILSSLDPNKRLLVVNNGVYGSRIAQIARLNGLPYVEIRSPLVEAPDLNRISAALRRDSKIGTVAMVHHETSTGMLNPVEAVGALTKKYRRRFLVDAISSLGAEKWDLSKSHTGICVGSTGKVLHGPVGCSFVLLSQEEVARVTKLKPRSLYLDLGLHLRAQETGEPLFTPTVPVWVAFHTALDEFAKEGLKKRISRYKERSVFLRSGFKKLKLEFFLNENLHSNSLTALKLPAGVSYDVLHKAAKRAGFVIYSGQSELKGEIFRIAHMGQLLQGDLKELLKALGKIIRVYSK